MIVRSLVDARRGRVDDATAAMRQALDLAAARRYIRSFLDEGPFHRLLLESAASGAADRAFAVRVVAA